VVGGFPHFRVSRAGAGQAETYSVGGDRFAADRVVFGQCFGAVRGEVAIVVDDGFGEGFQADYLVGSDAGQGCQFVRGGQLVWAETAVYQQVGAAGGGYHAAVYLCRAQFGSAGQVVVG
jgi:hypothetical protein